MLDTMTAPSGSYILILNISFWQEDKCRLMAIAISISPY